MSALSRPICFSANYHPRYRISLSTSSKFNLNFQKCTFINHKLKISAQISANSSTANVDAASAFDTFLPSNSNAQFSVTDDVITRHQKLKEEVRSTLINGCPRDSQKLEMIDAIQRLGVNYHFQTEIDQILAMIMEKTSLEKQQEEEDLYLVSLKFRLLRQNGHNISCAVFNKFKDDNNKVKSSIVEDVRGMLSLYEATHVRTHGEDILDEALPFTVSHLQSIATKLASPLSDQIKHALAQPYYLGVPRIEAREYIVLYVHNPSYNKTLLSFAKLDFNILQKQHQQELNDIAKWWKELDLAKKVPIATDKMVEYFFYSLAAYFEPQYRLAREILVKFVAIAVVFDDIYDSYATAQELEAFVKVIDRWDVDDEENLPEYMKATFKALIDLFAGIKETLAKQGKSYRCDYTIQLIKDHLKIDYEASKWFHNKYTPTMEEYMSLGLDSAGVLMVLAAALVGMGDEVTKDTFEWISSEPKIYKAACLMTRLVDDIADYESEVGKAIGSVECYEKQYNCTTEEAVEEIKKMIERAWKDINGELIKKPAPAPLPVLLTILNCPRVFNVKYKNGDAFSNIDQGVLKKMISFFLFDPVPM